MCSILVDYAPVLMTTQSLLFKISIFKVKNERKSNHFVYVFEDKFTSFDDASSEVHKVSIRPVLNESTGGTTSLSTVFILFEACTMWLPVPSANICVNICSVLTNSVQIWHFWTKLEVLSMFCMAVILVYAFKLVQTTNWRTCLWSSRCCCQRICIVAFGDLAGVCCL